MPSHGIKVGKQEEATDCNTMPRKVKTLATQEQRGGVEKGSKQDKVHKDTLEALSVKRGAKEVQHQHLTKHAQRQFRGRYVQIDRH